jgi:hypothetical protein
MRVGQEVVHTGISGILRLPDGMESDGIRYRAHTCGEWDIPILRRYSSDFPTICCLARQNRC